MPNSRWDCLSTSKAFRELDSGGYLDCKRCGDVFDTDIVSDPGRTKSAAHAAPKHDSDTATIRASAHSQPHSPLPTPLPTPFQNFSPLSSVITLAKKYMITLLCSSIDIAGLWISDGDVNQSLLSNPAVAPLN